MKRLLLPVLLLSSLAACDSKAQELLCIKAGKVTVHYKNADDVYYNPKVAAWYVIYNDTKEAAGGVVFYSQEMKESCRVIN